MEAPYADAAVQPGFTHAFVQSFFVILATEIGAVHTAQALPRPRATAADRAATAPGDKTFFIAAIMAMRHSRLTVWTGAVGALVVMTSTLAPRPPAPRTPPPRPAPRRRAQAYTHYAAVLLFLFFGVRMLREAKDAGEGASDELEEVELELAKKDDVETVLLQAFTLTFLAEWGDRSQIATIALGAAEEPVGVTLGAIIGHSLCTGLAVVGGKMLASRISERMVLGIGGGLFLLFAAISLLQGPDA
ncbi:hypothetical protein EMIHUDRAFT_61467 [Emiliania huxleyi CCMP1516]|uniref:GDT1 family protein n=2 Tax=Emiliania huxleyi TaxID=2903 RepID=A0A0D3J3S4_EMIH1|nr:hypothetical protein EMIHUDRAFT_61467 [Emiliania huxleyi CCMP1516]EOD18159.1 hypothetical protein EMIHUDRAFT_61467 [Emiliania huxleyi CCMP1516]|eukprot:XP_005770588.1 hypothetical protein EMIHUDRAFT_61467 [Emiliania huxleyi CCMP1516]